jgi:hypothetical protein
VFSSCPRRGLVVASSCPRRALVVASSCPRLVLVVASSCFVVLAPGPFERPRVVVVVVVPPCLHKMALPGQLSQIQPSKTAARVCCDGGFCIETRMPSSCCRRGNANLLPASKKSMILICVLAGLHSGEPSETAVLEGPGVVSNQARGNHSLP